MDALERLRWRCRRGTRELDALMSRYLEKCYGGASLPHRQAFADLLEFDDPQLYGLLTGQVDLDEGAHKDVIRAIIRGAGNIS